MPLIMVIISESKYVAESVRQLEKESEQRKESERGRKRLREKKKSARVKEREREELNAQRSCNRPWVSH